MLVQPPRAQAPPWSNGLSADDDDEEGGGIHAIGGAVSDDQGKVDGVAIVAEEGVRGRLPLGSQRFNASSALSASPNTGSSSSGTSDQEWRRSLHADFDPIYKESGRSSSREPGKRQSPPSTNAVPIQVDSQRPSLLASRMPSAAPTDSLTFAGSSPSSLSSFSHRAAPTNIDPNKIWGHDSGSPTGRGGGANMANNSTTDMPDQIGSGDVQTASRAHAWQHPVSRRSLSNSGMAVDREQNRPPGVQRALSINTSSLIGQGTLGQNFSPSSLRSTSPDNFNGSGNMHSSPRHGLGRLPEGEEATDNANSFFTPIGAQNFLPNHYGGVSRMRSTSSAAALQGAMLDRSAYVGRNAFDPAARSASVWSNVPATADVMGSSPSSFTYMHAASARPSSLSRFASEILQSPSERGRARETFGMQQHQLSHHPAHDVYAQSAQTGAVDSMIRSDSDSRRHSLAAAPPLAGQRRAIGFEVNTPTAAGGRANSVGRFAHVASQSSGTFGRGNLAFTDDDLASDLDALRIRASDNRVAAPSVGGQAASLPPAFHSFRPSPPDRQDESGWPAPVWNAEKREENLMRNANMSSLAGPFSAAPSKQLDTSSPSAPIPLSDHAIASLATLGPLAPPSGGPMPQDAASSLQDLGKGVPLQMLSRDTRLYIIEFKQGRTDLYFRQSQPGTTNQDADDIRKGDLVIVEADRGKDLGSVINDSITVEQVQTFLAQQAELAQMSAAAGGRTDGVHPAASTLTRLTRSVNPKRLFAKAGPADTSLLHAKAQDEERALTLCSTKVNQRGLPMAVVAAEMQWDRRKLTFYYTATQRVDFRDLVKELFRLYKTRIWMCHLSHPTNGATATQPTQSTTSTSRPAPSTQP